MALPLSTGIRTPPTSAQSLYPTQRITHEISIIIPKDKPVRLDYSHHLDGYSPFYFRVKDRGKDGRLKNEVKSSIGERKFARAGAFYTDSGRA